MRKEKTIKKWLDELPEPFKSQAIFNAQNHSLNIPIPKEYLSKALCGAFVWNDSPEGHKYWQIIKAGIELGLDWKTIKVRLARLKETEKL